ncbi:Acg family FMN-binding oxidoreductase [Brevundimonas sp. TWP1-2-1b1]|uniref:Acg family FMN-binding oxidoreductase n=1 Tax=unclassified Brevundimonas TaxID=2622653 RepID=UPI003CF7D0EF
MNRRRILIGAGATLALGAAGGVGWRASTGSLGDYDLLTARFRAPLTDAPALTELIRYAALAASGHNTQPWRFRLSNGVVDILPDLSRRTPAVDPDDHHLYVSLGCAAENLRIAAGATGRPGELTVGPDGRSLRYSFTSGSAQPDPLFAAIPARRSSRTVYDGRLIPANALAQLRQAAAAPGVAVHLLTDRTSLDRVRELVVAGNTAQMADPAFMAELKHWLRFNPRAALRQGDGLFSAASGSPILPDGLGRLAFDRFFTAASENARYEAEIASSAAVAVFVAERSDPAHWIAVGRACQRLMLAATGLGLSHAFVNQPVEVAALRPELAALVGEGDKRPDLLLRLGYGSTLPLSPRRSVGTVII